MMGKLRQQCRIAADYGKTVVPCWSFLTLAATHPWLKVFIKSA
ncbi:MAG: hypothetical protein ACK4YM_02775 [Novosphingobium sp.]